MTRLFSYYGDDFTGSTDVMEALASHGLDTILFTRLPTATEFEPFANCEAVGLAGISRSQSPAWMDANLPAIFTWLRTLQAHFCHYKVCSTFDSSPQVGSIGRAMEIGLAAFGQASATLLLGAPQIKRYTFAGHLFAAYEGQVYRIDRHPVMRVHPVTPMDESDVLRHLSKQTSAVAILLDVHDSVSQRVAGEALLRLPDAQLPFVVGSSGVEYAVMAAQGRPRSTQFKAVPAVRQMLVVSGSVSPTTARQIAFAEAHGFVPVSADALKLAHGEYADVLGRAHAVLAAGGSPLVYTASGPSTDQGLALRSIAGGRDALSRSLGQIARRLVKEFALKRLVIAGGDTSSHALGELNIHALSTRFPLAQSPGSPLCLAHSNDPAFHGLEVAMKGGQVGRDDYFVQLKDGIA